MPQRSRGVTLLVPIGAVLGLSAGAMIIINNKADPLWILAGGGTAIVVALSAWGMWRLGRWALWTSWALAVAALMVGVFGAHFLWTFWFLERPTLANRIKAVLLNLPIMLFLVCPLIWLAYFTRPAVRAQFRRVSENKT